MSDRETGKNKNGGGGGGCAVTSVTVLQFLLCFRLTVLERDGARSGISCFGPAGPDWQMAPPLLLTGTKMWIASVQGKPSKINSRVGCVTHAVDGHTRTFTNILGSFDRGEQRERGGGEQRVLRKE